MAGVLALVLLATACAGRAFTRPSVEGFVVGKSTEAEIRQRFGSPYREGTVVKNNETMKTLAYAYATTMTSAPGGVVPARGQGFYFWGDVLVGHDFTSSFPEDRTDFDGAKATQIKKGETTEASVEAVLGKPHGTYVYPLINDKTTRGAVYLYQQTRGTAFDLKIYQQILVVQYDTAGVVKEVEYTAAGER
jgi:hypothetical protein